MSTSVTKRLASAAVVTIAALLFTAGAAAAVQPSFVLDLPAGLACDFPLRLESTGGNQVNKEFLDKNGNVVRTLSAGSGAKLVLTNLDTGAVFSSKGGSVAHVTWNADGSQLWVTTGHNVLILFPTDVGGPATTLTVGRVEFTVDATGVFDVRRVNGRTTDICAALSA